MVNKVGVDVDFVMINNGGICFDFIICFVNG